MAKNMMDNGIIIRCKVKEYILGLVVKDMKDSTRMIRCMGRAK
jgi:hypothetical protein